MKLIEIKTIQICRCQDYDVVLSDGSGEINRPKGGYRTTITSDIFESGRLNSDESLFSDSAKPKPLLNERITKRNPTSKGNLRKEAYFDKYVFKPIPTRGTTKTKVRTKTERTVVKITTSSVAIRPVKAEITSMSPETINQPTTEFSLEQFLRRKSVKFGGLESYLNDTNNVYIKSYDKIIKNNTKFDLEALLNIGDDDVPSKNAQRRHFEIRLDEFNSDNKIKTATHKDKVEDKTTESDDIINFSDLNPVTEHEISNSNLRKNFENMRELVPKFVKMQFDENGQIIYSMVNTASDVVDYRPSEIIVSQPIVSNASENIYIDGNELRTFNGAQSSFRGVPIKLLRSLLRSSNIQTLEKDVMATSSPEFNQYVISYLQKHAQNLGDIIYGRNRFGG